MKGFTNLNITLLDYHFRSLKKAKEEFGSNWESFILAMLKEWRNGSTKKVL